MQTDDQPEQERPDKTYSTSEVPESITVGDIKNGEGIAIGPGAQAHVDNRTGLFWDKMRIPLAVLVVLFLLLVIPIQVIAIANSQSFVETIRDTLQLPLFEAERPGETLVIVVPFFHTQGVIDTDEAQTIAHQIQHNPQAKAVRVEVAESQSIRADDEEQARTLAERYKASMIIWGTNTGAEVKVSFLQLRQPNFDAADVDIIQSGVEGKTQLANPKAYAGFITQDLPKSMTFLTLFAVGQVAYSQQDYPKATIIISEALDLIQGIEPPVQGAADAYFRLGWLEQVPGKNAPAALASYTEALRLNPSDAAAYNNRGSLHAVQQHYEAARADYTEAIRLDPSLAEAYTNRGILHKVQQHYEAALADYSEAIRLDPSLAEAYYNRGILHYTQQHYEAALADYSEAIRLDPSYATAYYNRGILYYTQQHYEAALADYSEAIHLNPSDADAYYNRGLLYKKLAKPDQAIADFQKALGLFQVPQDIQDTRDRLKELGVEP